MVSITFCSVILLISILSIFVKNPIGISSNIYEHSYVGACKTFAIISSFAVSNPIISDRVVINNIIEHWTTGSKVSKKSMDLIC